MNNQDAKFILKEIDERIAKRRRPLFEETMAWLIQVRKLISGGFNLEKNDATALLQLYEKMTDPARIKWGHSVRL